jgi:hypothetical protein
MKSQLEIEPMQQMPSHQHNSNFTMKIDHILPINSCHRYKVANRMATINRRHGPMTFQISFKNPVNIRQTTINSVESHRHLRYPINNNHCTAEHPPVKII